MLVMKRLVHSGVDLNLAHVRVDSQLVVDGRRLIRKTVEKRLL